MQFNKNIEMYFAWYWVCAPQMKGVSSEICWRIASWIMHFLTPCLISAVWCCQFSAQMIRSGILSTFEPNLNILVWVFHFYDLYFHRIQFLLKKQTYNFQYHSFLAHLKSTCRSIKYVWKVSIFTVKTWNK